MDKGFAKFIAYEAQSRDTIDVKRLYIDMADDLSAGILLSQIVFWYLPTKDGSDKLRIEHDGNQWIANTREDWWNQVRLKPRQFDRAAGILETKGLVTKGLYKFKGNPTVHVRLNLKAFLESLNGIIVKSISPIRNMELTDTLNGSYESVKSSISEITTKNTTESGAIAPIKDSNLVKAYMDKQEADGMEPLRPSPAEIGMLKTMASKGVTSQELPKLIDNCFVDKKYSVDYLLKNIVSLRAKVIESKKDKRAEWYAPKKYKYKSVCDCGGFEEFHFDAKAEWCWRCNKRAKLFEVSTDKEIKYAR